MFRGTKGVGAYYNTKVVSLFNGASAYNAHPVVIKANGPDVLAFEDSTGTIKWHWNMLSTGLNFVESNVADYRLFLQAGGKVGINTNTPTATLDVTGSVATQLRTITYNSTIADDDYTVIVTSTGNGTVFLPDASSSNTGRIYVIKRGVNNTSTLTVKTTSNNAIDGGTSVTNSTAYGVIVVQSDGSKYWTIR